MSSISRQIKNLQNLRTELVRATADGKVTKPERQKIAAARKAVDVFGDGMLLNQAGPSEKVAARVKVSQGKNTLLADKQALVTQINGAINTMRTINQKAVRTNPFAKLPGKWTPAFQGVRTRSINRPNLKVDLVAIDLLAAGVKLEATSKAERGRTVSQFARARGAEIAVNGDFFSFGTFKPSGLAMSDGKVWPGTSHNGFEGYIGFNGQRAAVVDPGAGRPEWVKNAVSSRPVVLQNGKVVTHYPSHVHQAREPRTAIGVSRDGRMLILATVDGRSSASRGMTPAELGKLLKANGAWDALSMDAGGSATMYVRGKGVVNRPSDGNERRVANALLVQAAPRPKPKPKPQ